MPEIKKKEKERKKWWMSGIVFGTMKNTCRMDEEWGCGQAKL